MRMSFRFQKIKQFVGVRHKIATLGKPIWELPYIDVKTVDSAYNLYVEMMTFQPGSSRWISELKCVEL